MRERFVTSEELKRPRISMFLTRDKRTHLTGRRQRGSQAQVLRMMGIEHRVRPDGHIIVLRRHVAKLFGAETENRSASEPMPNWRAA